MIQVWETQIVSVLVFYIYFFFQKGCVAPFCCATKDPFLFQTPPSMSFPTPLVRVGPKQGYNL